MQMSVVFAQKDVQFTQFGSARSIINPALTGLNSYTEISILARQQWTGFSKAPSTQFISYEQAFKKRWGLGASLIHDNLGFENNYDMNANAAYYYPLSESTKLSFGLGLNVINKNLSGNELIYDDMTDPNGIYTDESKTGINLNAGIGISSEKFSIGISSRHLSNQGIKSSDIFSPIRHYYLYSSYQLKINDQYFLRPSILIKSNAQKTELNLNLCGEFVNTLILGVNFRYEESLALIIGIQAIKNLKVSYSYDIISGPVNKVSPASHELLLTYKFRKNPPKAPYLRSPRYFN